MEKNSKVSLEFKVGVFVIAAIFAVLLFIFKEGKLFQSAGYTVTAAFNFVGGLELGAPVRVSGVRVGEVARIEIPSGTAPQVLVSLKLDPGTRIGRNSRVSIRTLGIVGEKYIEISPTPEKEVLHPGDAITGIDPIALEEFADVGSEIIRNMNKVLDGVQKMVGDEQLQERVRSIISNTDGVMSKTSVLMDRMQSLTASLERTSDDIHGLVSANSDRVGTTLDNISGFAGTGKDVVERLGKQIDEFSRTQKEFRDTAVAGRQLIERLQNEGLVAKLLKEEDLLDQFKKDMASFGAAADGLRKSADGIAAIVGDVSTVTGHVRDGQGTVGKLLMDDEIYNEVNEFVKDIKQNPWKIFIRRK